MVDTFLTAPIFQEIILPFLLIFTVIFAILQRSKILGDDVKQINAITSLVIAVIAVSFAYSTGVITKLMPFLAVSVVILLVFFILFSFAITDPKKDFHIPKGIQITLGILIGIALIVAILWATGGLDWLRSNIGGNRDSWTTNIILLVVLGGAIALLVSTAKGED